MNYAVIDLGSNTIRLSVYRYEENKIVTVIRQKEVAGLAGYIKDNRLELAGIHKACDILHTFKEIASRFVEANEIHVFATASLRGIYNQKQALEMIKFASGLIPEILSGEEEARLDFTGASHYVECKDGILIDIGGASTELVLIENSQPLKLASRPIGCLSLYTDFVGQVIPTERDRKKIKKEIRDQLDSIRWSEREGYPLMIGIGGTVRAAHKLSSYLFSVPKEQKTMQAGYVKEILKRLKRNEDEIFRTVYKLIPERTLTIFPGLMILNEAIKKFGCESISVSGYGVREGYLIDRILKEGEIVSAG